MTMRIVLALFLAAHAFIHLSYLRPAPPATAAGPSWPFDMGKSWLPNVGLAPDAVRLLGSLLILLLVAGFVAAALSTAGIIVPQAWWGALIAAGAITSIATLVAFFHPWIVLGLAIDAVLLYVVFVAQWQPFGLEA
jgi:hypothetical protein